MYKAVILPSAREDIRIASRWYGDRQKGLDKRFIAQVRQAVKYIRANPHSIAVRYDETRTAVLDVFPFMIHYSIEESKKLIVISAIFHTSLSPERWKDER